MKTIVYKVSFPSNKSYIGITCRGLHKRKLEHYSRSRKGYKTKFYTALRKYMGQENWTILETCKNHENAKMQEKQYIKAFNTLEKGYNLTEGGDGSAGYKVSEETRRKLSEGHKGHTQSPETVEKRMQKCRGAFHRDCKKVTGTHRVTGKKITYKSITELEREGIFLKCCVARCCKGERKTHRNYFWEYGD